MKASQAATASALVSAIQISCRLRFAFDCWLFGSLLRVFALLCTRAALLSGCRPDLADRLPEPESAIGHGELGRDRQAASLQVEQQLAPVLRAFPHAVSKSASSKSPVETPLK